MAETGNYSKPPESNHKNHFERTNAEGKPARFEDWSEANQCWYKVHATRVGGEGSSLVAAIYDDITERKKTESALRQSEERFRNLVIASSDIVYKVSADWKLMYNFEGKNILADTNESASWADKYIPEHEKQRLQDATGEAILHKKMFELEHDVFRADGRVVSAHSREVPVVNDRDEIIEWIGVAHFCQK